MLGVHHDAAGAGVAHVGYEILDVGHAHVRIEVGLRDPVLANEQQVRIVHPAVDVAPQAAPFTAGWLGQREKAGAKRFRSCLQARRRPFPRGRRAESP